MAYRFQDLQGNWRMRFDDGTTSQPINPDDLSPRERDANLEVKDTNAAFKSTYGVDTSFGSSSAALGGAKQAREEALQAAIVQRQLSNNRIATYTSEFQPLAEMANTQGTLIENVAANPAADVEARAGAFQALYPGMQVEVDNNGNLSFSAKSSDLGFSYPDKEKLKQENLRQRNPGAATDYGAKLDSLQNAIGQMQQITSPEQASVILSDAAAMISEATLDKRAMYRTELTATSPIARLENDLEKARILDASEAIRLRSMGYEVGGDSPPTLEIQRQLEVAKAVMDKDVEERMAADPDLNMLVERLNVLKVTGQHYLSQALTDSSLVNPSVMATLTDSVNEDGSVATPQQTMELRAKVNAKDPIALTIADLPNMTITEAVLTGQKLTGNDKKWAARVFDKMAGEPGMYEKLSKDIANFDEFVAKSGLVLSDADKIVLKDATSSLHSSDAARKAAAAKADQLKTDLIVGVYRNARDNDWNENLRKSKTVPPHERAAEVWKRASDDLSNQRIGEIKRATDRSSLFGAYVDYHTDVKLKDIKADPEKYAHYTAAETIRRVGELLGRDAYGTDRAAAFAELGDVATAIHEWLEPQIKNAAAANVLGPIRGLSKEEIQAILVESHTRAMRSGGYIIEYAQVQ